jgi:pimeloyl-ACP methyl ester carboxylesterase
VGLYVRESGLASAFTFVFLHGGGASGWTWKPVVDQLPDYHCLVPDLPEHGQSMAEIPFSIKDAAARIADLIRSRAHGGRAHVVGLSLGAQITVQLLSTSPKLVDHALISGALVRSIPGISLINATARLYMPFRNIGFMVRANMRSFGIPAEYFAEFAADTRSMTADSFARVTTENATFRIPPGLDRVKSPTLIVVGQKELKVMHESARDLLVAIPNAQGRIAANVGHNWSLEAPNLFTQVVRAWINGQPLPQQLVPLS